MVKALCYLLCKLASDAGNESLSVNENILFMLMTHSASHPCVSNQHRGQPTLTHSGATPRAAETPARPVLPNRERRYHRPPATLVRQLPSQRGAEPAGSPLPCTAPPLPPPTTMVLRWIGRKAYHAVKRLHPGLNFCSSSRIFVLNLV